MKRMAPSPALVSHPYTSAVQNPPLTVAGLISNVSVPLKVGSSVFSESGPGKICCVAQSAPSAVATPNQSTAATR